MGENAIYADELFTALPGCDLADYCMALVGIARSTGRVVRGKFNGIELHAWRTSTTETMIGQYLLATQPKRKTKK